MMGIRESDPRLLQAWTNNPECGWPWSWGRHSRKPCRIKTERVLESAQAHSGLPRMSYGTNTSLMHFLLLMDLTSDWLGPGTLWPF